MSSQVERSFGLSRDSLDVLKNTQEEPIQDIKGTYNFGFVGSMDLTFFDTSALKEGIDHFRPLIRGFTICMLLFFVFKQVLSFIGQDPGMYASAQNKAETSIKNKGE